MNYSKVTPALVKELKKAVIRGGILLDTLVPGWYKSVKCIGLNLRQCDKCVIGYVVRQLPEDSEVRKRLLTGDLAYEKYYGFDIAYDYERMALDTETDKYHEEQFSVLKRYWVSEIKRRHYKAKKKREYNNDKWTEDKDHLLTEATSS